jgi:hypothetical protein
VCVFSFVLSVLTLNLAKCKIFHFTNNKNIIIHNRLQPIPSGAQVYDSYGQKCNHRFLLNYGFAVEDNRELDGFCPNEVPIELSLCHHHPNGDGDDDEEDPTMYSQKLEFWMRGEQPQPQYQVVGGSNGCTTSSSTMMMGGSGGLNHNVNSINKFYTKRVRVCVSNNENTRLLFSLLRAMNCNADELRSIVASSTSSSPGTAAMNHNNNSHPSPVTGDMRSLLFAPDNHHSHRNSSSSLGSYYRSCRDIRHPISIRNERMAMATLLQIISNALGKYPSSLSADKMDLLDERQYPPFSNRRHAKIQVRGEKEVLHHYTRWARLALDVMDVIEQELKDEEQRGVEVQLGRGIIFHDDQSRSCGYDYIIRRMEDDEENVHHTIVRYCADVLGSLRREEFKNLRRNRTSSSSPSSTSVFLTTATTATSRSSGNTPPTAPTPRHGSSSGKRGDGYC